MGSAEREVDDRIEFFRLSLDMLTVVAKGGIALQASDAWHTVLGYDPAQVIGKNVFNLIHPDDLERAVTEATQAEYGKPLRQVQSRMRTKAGFYRWLEWSISPTASGEVMYCVARDIHDLKQHQDQTEMMLEALQASAQALEETAMELDRTRAEAEFLANHDMLTGLLNRRAWLARIEAQPPSALAVLDIDFFKRVNDSFGHPAGDDVLASVADRIAGGIGAGPAIAGRLGGEEFGIAFMCDISEAEQLVESVLDATRKMPILTRSGAIPVTMSAGLAPWDGNCDGRGAIYAPTYDAADRALYAAKGSGRNRLISAASLAA